MREFLKSAAYVFCFVMLAGLVSACANMGKPSGGEKDSRGPEILGVIPPPGARNFMEKEVVFYFDEFLKPGNYSKEVFISPIPKVRPEVLILNKKLTIRFKEPLLENTTYVITLGKEIKDFTEGNEMARSFTYAFSTGAELDTLSFGGKVESAWGGKGEDGMTVLLFPESDISGDSIFGKRPVYAFETDNTGSYTFQYLRAGRYKVYGVRDVDNDFSYSQPKEILALAANPLIDLNDSAARSKPVMMYSFTPDAAPPVVKNVKWANDRLVHVEFGEEVLQSGGLNAMQISVQDSNGSNRLIVNDWRFKAGDGKHLYFISPVSRKNRIDVAFNGVSDSLGHRMDTILRLSPDAMVKEDKGKNFETPVFIASSSELILHSFYPMAGRIDSMSCFIKDSAGMKLKAVPSVQGMSLTFKVLEKPDPAKRYIIVLDTGFQLVGAPNVDTSLKVPFVFPDPLKFGSLSGVVEGDSAKPGMKYIVILSGPPIPSANKKEKAKNWSMRLSGPGPFSIPSLPAGTYQVMVIEDADGNGYLTPGSIHPYRLPEAMITGIPPIEVKGNWELKNQKIICKKPAQDSKLKGSMLNPGDAVAPGKQAPPPGKGKGK